MRRVRLSHIGSDTCNRNAMRQFFGEKSRENTLRRVAMSKHRIGELRKFHHVDSCKLAHLTRCLKLTHKFGRSGPAIYPGKFLTGTTIINKLLANRLSPRMPPKRRQKTGGAGTSASSISVFQFIVTSLIFQFFLSYVITETWTWGFKSKWMSPGNWKFLVVPHHHCDFANGELTPKFDGS